MIVHLTFQSLCILRSFRLCTFVFIVGLNLVFMSCLSTVLEQCFFFECGFNLWHYHSLRNLAESIYLQHVFLVLLQIVFQFCFRHRCYLAQFQSDLKTLLKLCLFVITIIFLENVRRIGQFVYIRASLIQAPSLLQKKLAVFRSTKRSMHKSSIINILIYCEQS